MPILQLTNWIKGLFHNQGEGARISDDFLTKCHNVDISQSGKIRRRRGYTYWEDLLNGASTADDGVPDVTGRTGFPNKVQAIKSWTDVGGNKYIFVVTNGKVYAEIIGGEGDKIWVCLNPSGDIDFDEVSRRFRIVSYLDVVFFLDLMNNVYMYNSQAYTGEGWSSTSSKFIYLAGDRIYYRDFATYAPDYHDAWAITAIDAGTDKWTVAGDVSHMVEVGDKVTVAGCIVTAANNGEHEVSSVTVIAGPNTEIVVDFDVTGTEIEGTIASPFRVKIENSAGDNSSGTAIYDGLVDVGYIGVGKVITTPSDLKLGFCRRKGDAISGYYYYVLDNQLNQRATDKVYIIKFNDRFIAQDYIGLDMDADGRVISFCENEQFLYIWAEDGKMHRIDKESMLGTAYTDTDGIGDLEAPIDNSGKKQYAIEYANEKLFVYSKTLPGNISDNENEVYFWDGNDELPYNKNSINRNTIAVAQIQFCYHPGHGGCVFNGYVWGMATGGGTIKLVKLDPVAKTNIAEISVPYHSSRTFQVLGAGDYIWISKGIASVINRVHKTTHVATTHTWSGTPGRWAFDGTDVWTYQGQVLLRINLTTGAVSNTYYHSAYNAGASLSIEYVSLWPWAAANNGIAFDGTKLWCGAANVRGVLWEWYIVKINPSTGADEDSYSIPSAIIDVLYAENKIWVLCIDFKVRKVNITTGVIESTTDTLTPPGSLFYGAPAALTFDSIYKKFYVWFGTDYVGRYNNDFTVQEFAYESFAWCQSISFLVFSNDCGWFMEQNNNACYFDVERTRSQFLIPLDASGRYTQGIKNIFMQYAATPLVQLSIINYLADYLYFGNSCYQATPATDADLGLNYKWNLESLTNISDKSSDVSCQKMLMDDDPQERFFLQGNPDYTGHDARWRIGYSWDYTAGGTVYENFSSFLTFRSNLLYHVDKQIVELSGPTVIDRIQHLGTPKKPSVTLAVKDPAGDLLVKTKLKYYTALVFYDGRTTELSLASDELIVPDTGGAPGGEKVKAILSSLNLQNILGQSIYAKSDVDKIQIYRSQLNDGEMAWTEPLILAEMEKGDEDLRGGDDQDWYYYTDSTTTPFDKEIYEDWVEEPVYNPFTTQNVLSYPVRDMTVHKARLILINKTDAETSNLILFSTTDIAEAIPPQNQRFIEAGDGDYLTAARSAGDYLYLFKAVRIYAILGDAPTGQLMDISATIGGRYRDMIGQFSRMIFWMNENGIYALSGYQIQNLMQDAIKDFFDGDFKEGIDFAMVEDHGFVHVDKENEEIRWHVPCKREGVSPNGNNRIIIYNLKWKNFRTHSYSDSPFVEENSEDVQNGTFQRLFTDYAGNIFRLNRDKNDDGKAVNFAVVTKDFNFDTYAYAKRIKALKVAGRFDNDIRVTYWLDGERKEGKVIVRPNRAGVSEGLVPVYGAGRIQNIAVEISGKDKNQAPIEIDEVLIMYERLRRMI